MEFKKQLFIFSDFKIENIKIILGEVSLQEIELKLYANTFPKNKVLGNLIYAHDNLYNLGATQNRFKYVYVVSEYNPSILNAIKLSNLIVLVIEISTSDHADFLSNFGSELEKILDLQYEISEAWQHAGISMAYQSKKINSYIDSCEQHLSDAQSDVSSIVKEIYKNYKRIYQVYSALQVEDHHR